MRKKVTRKTYTPKVITVRDRREVHQFSIHNRVIDEWIPIIGVTGYTLYSLYVRMSNSADERAYPGFASIREHFGFSRNTIIYYNELLVWCGLVHIERYKLKDGRRYRNDYLILPIPEASEDARDRVRRRVAVALAEELALEKPAERWVGFLELVITRVDSWQSIQMIWTKNRPRNGTIKVSRAQLELPFAGDNSGDNSKGAVPPGNCPGSPRELPRFPQGTTPVPPGNYPGSPRELEQSLQNNPYRTILTEQSNNNSDAVVVDTSLVSVDVLFERLVQAGIGDNVARDLVASYDAVRIDRQLEWFPRRLAEYHAADKEVRNPAGLLIKSIENDWLEPTEAKVEKTDEQDHRYYGCGLCGELFWSEFPRCDGCGRCGNCCECGKDDGEEQAGNAN